MSPEDVRKYYKTYYNFSQETGMSHGSLMNWVKNGYVPIASQVKLFKLTKGKLKLDFIDEGVKE